MEDSRDDCIRNICWSSASVVFDASSKGQDKHRDLLPGVWGDDLSVQTPCHRTIGPEFLITSEQNGLSIYNAIS